MTKIYGIKNCDTVKKARKWLDDADINYHFIDFREDGIDRKKVSHWIQTLGWETIVNKRSTTWKQLDPAIKENMNENAAIEAIMQQPTLIKRPLLELPNITHVGFKAAEYEKLFNR
jgi:Spx/MgsR family transcriptional regulator